MLERYFISHWERSVPLEVQRRFADLDVDLEQFKERGLIPSRIKRALDVGSGSGAGSVALRKHYPLARIIALDNSATHQERVGMYSLYERYQVRRTPFWAADFRRQDVQEFVSHQTEGKFDIVMGAHFPVMYDRSPTWRETCVNGVGKMVALTRLLKEDGTLLIGYNPGEDEFALRALSENYCLSDLFGRIHTSGRRDNWLIMQSPNPHLLRALQVNPEELLTDLGRREVYPYMRRVIIDWDT